MLVGAPKTAPLVRLELRNCFDWEDAGEDEIKKYFGLQPFSEIGIVTLTDGDSQVCR